MEFLDQVIGLYGVEPSFLSRNCLFGTVHPAVHRGLRLWTHRTQLQLLSLSIECRSLDSSYLNLPVPVQQFLFESCPRSFSLRQMPVDQRRYQRHGQQPRTAKTRSLKH